MKRLIIVYNPHSANYGRVQTEVIRAAYQLDGWMIGRYSIKAASVNYNAKQLVKILQDGDLVVVAGGDGTASVGVNAAMLTNKKITLGILGYGNFNDLAHTLGTRNLRQITEAFVQKQTATMWPLAISVNNEFWRYAACYVTVGLLADSTQVFDEHKTRQKIQKRRYTLAFSLWSLAHWYLHNRKQREFLPKVYLNGQDVPYAMTDYMAINSKKVANVMKGGDWYLQKKAFWRAVIDMKRLRHMIAMMLRSVVRRVPGKEVLSDVLEFHQPASVGVQIEGEYHRLHKVSKITVDKAKRGISVIKIA